MKISTALASGFTIFLSIFLASCGDDELRYESKDDAKVIFDHLKSEEGEEKAKKFQKAITAIGMKATIESPDDVEGAMNRMLKGKTADEIISFASEISEETGKEFMRQAFQKSFGKDRRSGDSEIELEPIYIGGSVVISDVEVKVKGVKIGGFSQKKQEGDSYLSYKAPKGEFVIVLLEYKNLSDGKIVDVQDIWEDCSLVDDLGNNYDPFKFSFNSHKAIAGKMDESIRIKPGESYSDIAAFELPIEKAGSFSVKGRLGFFKKVGERRLRRLSEEKVHLKFNRDQLAK